MPRSLVRPIAAILLALGLSSCVTETMEQLALAIRLQGTQTTQLEVDGNKLYILGILNGKTFDQVREVFDEDPNVDTLVFTAMPGSADDETTFAMGRWLREKKLHTHLLSNSVIASGAVDLYLSGIQRTAEEGAQLGVHSWDDGSNEATDFPRDHEDHRLNASYIDTMLGSENFYWYTIEAASSDDIHWMTTDEVEKFGLLTSPWSQPSGDETPFGPDFENMRAGVLED